MDGIKEIKVALDNGDTALLKQLVDRKAYEAQLLEEYGRGGEGLQRAADEGNLDAFLVILKLDGPTLCI